MTLEGLLTMAAEAARYTGMCSLPRRRCRRVVPEALSGVRQLEDGAPAQPKPDVLVGLSTVNTAVT